MNHSNVISNQRTHWQQIVTFLVEPAQSVPLVERRNARLSTWLTLLMTIVSWPVVVIFPANIQILSGAIFFTVAYLLCRTRHFRLGIYLVIVGFGSVPLLSTALRSASADQSTIVARLIWLVPLMLIASSVLPLRPNVIFVGVIIMAVSLMPLYGINLSFASIGLGATFIGVTGGLILIFLNHRNLLEQDRQAELRATNDALRESESILEQRVIERTQQLEIARQEAEKARHEAEQANEVKSQFLANMSHELRTPLNAILNFTAFVSDGIMGPVNDEQVDALQQSIGSGKHLLALINDVLDITKIETGLMDMFIQRVDLNEAVEVIVSMSKGLLKGKSIQLHTHIDEQLPITYGDKRRLRQVFLNVVSNAIKFTTEGSVTIGVSHTDTHILFTVADTGMGIAPENHALVFQSFKQAKHDSLDTPGTGLGMPISKFFVEAHGGRIWFESAVGVGTTFFVELPILTEQQANALTVNSQRTT